MFIVLKNIFPEKVLARETLRRIMMDSIFILTFFRVRQGHMTRRANEDYEALDYEE